MSRSARNGSAGRWMNGRVSGVGFQVSVTAALPISRYRERSSQAYMNLADGPPGIHKYFWTRAILWKVSGQRAATSFWEIGRCSELELEIQHTVSTRKGHPLADGAEWVRNDENTTSAFGNVSAASQGWMEREKTPDNRETAFASALVRFVGCLLFNNIPSEVSRMPKYLLTDSLD
jgi:hypothetical protein